MSRLNSLKALMALLVSLFGLSLGAASAQVASPDTRSFLWIMNIYTGEKKMIYQSDKLFEAPNWSRDGQFLVFNTLGKLYRIPITGGTPELIDTGTRHRLNNDHGLSPDGSLIVISDQTEKDNLSRVYVLPASGGEPKLVSPTNVDGPSYWHAWSPDGKTLVYTARRGQGDKQEWNLYAIPVDGGKEVALTEDPSLDDGPDYGPDGRIYFNSPRSGVMRLYRMNGDGSDETLITHDPEYGDWFPHPSPDNKWIVFLSFDVTVPGHPPNKDVVLRLMPVDQSAPPKVIVKLFGGQGTINVPSWSPDSQWFAYVTYEEIPQPKKN